MIAERLKAIFPYSTWTFVEKLLYPGEQRERLVKHRLAATRDFTVDELATLLRTEHGFEILVDLMGEAKPKWWRLCAPLMEAAEARKLQHAARLKIERAVQGAMDADEDLRTDIARSEAALSFQDADFMRPHIDGLRAQMRAPNSAVASPAKGRGRR